MRGPNLLANTAASALQAHAAHRHFLQRDHRLAAHRGPLARLARTIVFDVTVKYGRRRTADGDLVHANDGRRTARTSGAVELPKRAVHALWRRSAVPLGCDSRGSGYRCRSPG